jgi:peptide/nickel transport system permease protein
MISIVVGTLLGMIAGSSRGIVDEIVCRAADVMYSFPAIVVAILISALIRPGSSSAIAAVVLVTLPIIVRMVRAATLQVAGRSYVIQARIMGAGAGRILAQHVFPNILGVIVVQAAYSISFGMIIESGISFLGLGVQPPNASLGSLVYEGRPYLAIAPWLVLFPGTVLMLTILSINLVGDGIRRVVDIEAVG